MSLEVTSDLSGTVPTSWDWKAAYVERLADGAGMELFTEASVSSDTMLLLAGPPRITQDGFAERLSPIGLVNSVNVSSDNQLRPNWEMGSDVTYFTRGKTMHTLSIGAMVANKPSLMKLMTRESPTASTAFPDDNFGQFWMNLDSDTTAAPFGILMLFNTKGSTQYLEGNQTIGSVYLENCNIGSFTFALSNQDIILQENVTIMFDRMIPVDYV